MSLADPSAIYVCSCQNSRPCEFFCMAAWSMGLLPAAGISSLDVGIFAQRNTLQHNVPAASI